MPQEVSNAIKQAMCQAIIGLQLVLYSAGEWKQCVCYGYSALCRSVVFVLSCNPTFIIVVAILLRTFVLLCNIHDVFML